jgi:hypothetical protein
MRLKNRTPLKRNVEQHSIGKSVLLHLFPGFVFSILYILGVRFTVGWGVPPFFVFLFVGLLFLIPFELGYLLYQAKTKNESFSLKKVVLFRHEIPKWQYIVLPVLLLGWAYFVVFAINPAIEKTITERFFSWVPEHYFLESIVNQIDQYSKSLLVVSAVVGIFFNAISVLSYKNSIFAVIFYPESHDSKDGHLYSIRSSFLFIISLHPGKIPLGS